MVCAPRKLKQTVRENRNDQSLTGAAIGGALGFAGGGGLGTAGIVGAVGIGIAGATYAVATEGTDGLSSVLGGLAGSIAGTAFLKASSPTSSSRVNKLTDQLANDSNLLGEDVAAGFAKSILDVNKTQNILAKLSAIESFVQYSTIVVDSSVWRSTFSKTFVDGVANSTYVDGGASFAAPGTLKPAFKIGVRISSKGVDGYYGFGLGSGSGASLTVNTSMGASNSIYTGASVKGGTGIYGYSLNGNGGSSGGSLSGGVGWGIGNGVSVGATHRMRLWSF